jgi:hypothetical protein
LDKSNILLRIRKNAYAVALQDIYQLSSYYIALSSAYLTLLKRQLHKDKVPEPLKGYNIMLKHLYLTKYKQAMLKEFNSLIDYKTFKYKNHLNNKKLVLLIWVYTNKFDKNGFFTNFKARLIAKRDLYKTEEETYTTTLVA